MKRIDVCLSPDLMHLYDVQEKAVVVVDILRATSCMTTAMAHGVSSIMPVAEVAACEALRAKGYLTAAERGGEKVEGFDFGNSPFEYMSDEIKGKKIGVTTTNGTRAISLSKGAKTLLIGAFLNLSSVAKFLNQQEHDILIVCAGWKGHVNLEDTLFAGALAEQLTAKFSRACDSTLVAITLYHAAKHDMLGFLQNSSHVQRLKNLNIEKDIAFSLQIDQYDAVAVLEGEELVGLKR
ncbi:2-phosphosulfolactate phosphatase [Catalinimonas alkaloidigena]|uniref:2-phosphosulfolactate phosphatase n=1 Tax=Catalinimonas alkaloidigena TaxID=1075417 RepID=UPI002404D698|nr:2-phosphosulfolactate phosphatase [Catalinimonas alkaloidigena]MDF9800905.1 2-phosphosulfolactate phosphatase [Catalinimonas alkaloidigena]